MMNVDEMPKSGTLGPCRLILILILIRAQNGKK